MASSEWRTAWLLQETQRFKELSRRLKISPRVLAKELVELEQHHPVTRTVRNTRPVTVAYAATAHAHTLGDVIHALHRWGMLHHATVVGPVRPPGSAEPRLPAAASS